jgi:predicted TIM-barrel fold metal-dependent hydrolase
LAAAALINGVSAGASPSDSQNAGSSRGRDTSRRIDVHHHFVPPPFLDANPDYRRITYFAEWTPQSAIEAMDKNGIALGITSLNAPGVALDDLQQGRTLARQCNEYAAQLARDHSSRFGAFAAVPALDPDGSLHEIAYALDVLRADGIGLMTSYRERYLASDLFTPMMEELNRRKAAVFVHPALPSFSMKMDPPLFGTFLEMPFDTARAILGMLLSGSFVRFPDIKFIFAHGGGGLPIVHQRLDYLFRQDPKLREKFPRGLMSALRNVYFDTVNVIDEADFALLRQIYSIDQLVFGTDHPALPAELNAGAIALTHLTAAERSAIERDNIARLLPRLR